VYLQRNAYLAKFSFDLTQIWANEWSVNPDIKTDDEWTNMRIDSAHNIFVAGPANGDHRYDYAVRCLYLLSARAHVSSPFLKEILVNFALC
jgi:hypothetical protein